MPKIWFKGKKLCRKCAPKVDQEKRLVAKFGITSAEYKHLMEFQGGVCAICRLAPRKSRYHVDHDHKTGRIRGVLCFWCNHKLLAGARESIEILERALAYLKHPPALALFGNRVVPVTLSAKSRKILKIKPPALAGAQKS